jgi:hypothetical protein
LILSCIALLIPLGIGVAVLPGLVNGVAYLTGAESSSVFLPLSYSQECGRGGCSTWTDGTLASGASVSWPRQVPLGREFPVPEPVWDWGFGAELINDDASAIASVVLGGAGRRFLGAPAGTPGQAGAPLEATPGAARSGCGPLTPVLGERRIRHRACDTGALRMAARRSP